jgi:hypothetical protein
MQKQFTAAAGTSLVSISLPNGTPIRGIQIDNPSGSWLYVSSEQQYCPPYTIGWAVMLSYSNSSVNVTAGNGPSGQVGTIQGDPYTVYLDSEAVAPSTGQPYQFTSEFSQNTLTASAATFVGSNLGINATVIPAVANKRIRVVSVNVSCRELRSSDAICSVLLSDFPVTAIYLGVAIGGPAGRTFSQVYTDGSMDFPVGAGMQMTASLNFASIELVYVIRYRYV